MLSNYESKEANRALAKRINEETRRDPASPYAGKYIAAFAGEVVVVADSPEEAVAALEADMRNYFKWCVFEGTYPEDEATHRV